MPRYFFNLSRSGEERYEDGIGEEYPNVEAAKGAAERVALELSDEGAEYAGAAIEVSDDTGETVAVVLVPGPTSTVH